jgi:glycogen operon protein
VEPLATSTDAPTTLPLRVEVRAPSASEVALVVGSAGSGDESAGGEHRTLLRRASTALRSAGWWHGATTASAGDHYWLVVDGGEPLVDPSVEALTFVDGRPVGVVRGGPWPKRPQLARSATDTAALRYPVIYEMHLRGFARTFDGARARLPYLRDLGIDVIELMPVHPFDASDSYWGYMPIVWGAVHQPYAAGHDAAVELADFVEDAHAHGLAVWIDVVFNHTGEGDPTRPTWTLRGFDPSVYRWRDDGRPCDDSGCGNDADPADPWIRDLVLEGLGRYADLGVDGFRFDLASLLTRDGGDLVRRIGDWAERRGVTLVAEPWDLAAYQVGRGFPDQRWAQWNDRFRDDVRGFLRAEPGLVPAMVQRVQGSPEIFDRQTWRSINFVDAHDGLTLHDLTIVTADRHRSWDCGPGLRPQQLRNLFTVLLLSAGPAMFVMGDEFGRTQDGHDNPYDVDGPTSWVDWSLLDRDELRELHDDVRRLLALRRHLDHEVVHCHGVHGGPDFGYESRSLAWHSGALYVMANAWWEPLTFTVQAPGDPAAWRFEFASSPSSRHLDDGTVLVAPRSVVVLFDESSTR